MASLMPRPAAAEPRLGVAPPPALVPPATRPGAAPERAPALRRQPAFATGMVAALLVLGLGIVAGDDHGAPRCPAAKLEMEARGRPVKTLQRALKRQGFDPGPVDGHFGPGTQQALTTFQRRHGITPRGTVAGSTWRPLLGGCGPQR